MNELIFKKKKLLEPRPFELDLQGHLGLPHPVESPGIFHLDSISVPIWAHQSGVCNVTEGSLALGPEGREALLLHLHVAQGNLMILLCQHFTWGPPVHSHPTKWVLYLQMRKVKLGR